MALRRGMLAVAALVVAPLIAGDALPSYDIGVAAREDGNYNVALASLEAALAGGDHRAALALGEMHEAGEGTAASPYRACEYYLKAAAAGLAEGQYRAGRCYRSGLLAGGGASAVEWFQRAADQGHVEAHCAAGEVFLAGLGVIRDAEQGFTRCLRGAEAGDPEAMDQVADLFWRGEGIEPDRDRATFWWARAAEKGNVDAAWRLGLEYKTGVAIAADPAQANTYLKRAFELGKLRAAAMLADLLVPLAESSDGIDQRIGTAALFWAGLSARIDDSAEFRSRSRFLYDELARKASSLVPRATVMIEEWLAQHPELDRGA